MFDPITETVDRLAGFLVRQIGVYENSLRATGRTTKILEKMPPGSYLVCPSYSMGKWMADEYQRRYGAKINFVVCRNLQDFGLICHGILPNRRGHRLIDTSEIFLDHTLIEWLLKEHVKTFDGNLKRFGNYK